uniref:Polymerase/primase n=1 Tax=Dulem virus 42 TaxID=3145760 RepID=A0AAU8BBX2_9CAUD
MLIHSKTVVVFDIEVFPNCFHCACKNTESEDIILFEISDRKSQLKELAEYFLNKELLFAGYNNHHYDDVIINYIIDQCALMSTLPLYRVTDSIFNLSQIIIQSEDNDTSRYEKWKYAKYFESMDILKMMFSSKLRVGLKEMQLTMHYPNVLEYEGDFNKPIPLDKIDSMIYYNVNDIESTNELLNTLANKGDIDLRLFIEKEYGINALSMDSVKFGEAILSKKVCEELNVSYSTLKEMRSPMDYIPLKDVILPVISYKNQILKEVLEEMKQQIVYSKERKGYEKKFVLSGTRFSVGVGGIHSLNDPEIFVPKNDEYIGHLDVASMYPSFIVRYGWFPRHLGKAGIDVYKAIYHDRIEAKHNGQKHKNLALKLVLNSVTGKMQEETSWMYDPFSVFKIRINGQLVLLMLVDILLQYNCKIVQVNTDGVMFIAKKGIESDLQESVTELERLTQLTFEGNRYEAFYQYAVNDYFGVEDGYSQSRDPKLIERKGMFITETNLGKGLTPVIIPEAVIKYFVDNVPLETTIKECKDIKKFVMGQRVGKKFSVEYNDKKIQRINRFYASTNGCYIYKVKEEDGKISYSNLLTKSGVTLLNKYDDIPIEERHINYSYYLAEARKIKENLKCRQLSLFD